jgi:hypothetical protein
MQRPASGAEITTIWLIEIAENISAFIGSKYLI